MNRLPPPGSPWRSARAAQRARRHVRVARRLGDLRDALPKDVRVEVVGPASVLLEGFGLRVLFEAVHNNAWIGSAPTSVVMSAQAVAREFVQRRRRWVKENSNR